MSKPKPGNLTDLKVARPDEKHHFSKHHYETFSMHHSLEAP